MDHTSLLIQRVRLAETPQPVDMLIRDGRIAAVAPHIAPDGAPTIDGAGSWCLPSLVDPHVHLDAVLTEGVPEPNRSGTLIEGIERWGQRKPLLSEADVTRRAEEAIRWHVAHGVLKIRTHVDVSDPALTALRALVKLRERLMPGIRLEIVAFPQDGLLSQDRGPELFEEALRLGADVVGGIPHYEWTREDGIESIQLGFRLAAQYGRPIDIHCDETDDDQSRFLETVVKLTHQNKLAGRVTASHTTALGSYNDAYAFKLIRMIKQAGVNIVANPLDNIVLQGRFDSYPKRRGMTRVKELLAEGVTVGAGHDSIMDPWYPLGTGSQLFVASMLAHVGQLTGSRDWERVLATVTGNAAAIMGLAGYGVRVGDAADLALFEAEDAADLIRRLPLPLYVVAAGRVVSTYRPSYPRVLWGDATETVTFARPGWTR